MENTRQKATPASRRRRQLSFEDRWSQGPLKIMFDASVSPDAANAMTWFIHLTTLARTRPLPAHIRADPAILAEPLSRETGWPLRACRDLIERMMSMTARQLRSEEINLPED